MKVIGSEGLREKGITLSRCQIWRLVRAKKFPAPIKISAGRNGWVESEIDTYLRDRIAERDAQFGKAA